MDKETCIKELSKIIRTSCEKLSEEHDEVLERKVNALKFAKEKVNDELAEKEKAYLLNLISGRWEGLICKCEGFPSKKQQEELDIIKSVEEKLQGDDQ